MLLSIDVLFIFYININKNDSIDMIIANQFTSIEYIKTKGQSTLEEKINR